MSDECPFYDIAPFCGKIMGSVNYPIEKAANLAGHISLDTTKNYFRFHPDVSELDSFFEEEKDEREENRN